MGCGDGDRFIDLPDGLGVLGATCGGGASTCGLAASMGSMDDDFRPILTISRVARGVLWRGVRVAAGVSGGAAVAMGAVAKRAPAEACWSGLLGLPLAFRASRSDSAREWRAFTSVSKNQLYIREVKKIDVYHYIFDTVSS